jgi:hypothetical protein
MPQETLDLNGWITRVQGAKRTEDVFAILDEFRRLEWSDEDRAAMAKVYVRLVQRLGAPAAAGDATQDEGEDDGPVWYEKM